MILYADLIEERSLLEDKLSHVNSLIDLKNKETSHHLSNIIADKDSRSRVMKKMAAKRRGLHRATQPFLVKEKKHPLAGRSTGPLSKAHKVAISRGVQAYLKRRKSQAAR